MRAEPTGLRVSLRTHLVLCWVVTVMFVLAGGLVLFAAVYGVQLPVVMALSIIPLTMTFSLVTMWHAYFRHRPGNAPAG